MIHKHRRLCVPVIALALAATTAPTASARLAEQFLGSGATQAAVGVGPAGSKVRVVEVPAGAGFDWGDAGIGAGAALATIGLGGALVLSGRRRHPRAATNS